MTKTLLQAFQWELPADGSHWRRLTEIAPQLKMLGFTGVWLPPAYKGAAGINDVGYGTYDLYDLGEFDQKGTVPTKYGTKEEYLKCIDTFHALEMEVYADVVLNHFLGADETEVVEAVAYDENNRNKEISGEEQIEAWSKFTFPGRQGKYDDYQWTWKNFKGVDYDSRQKQHAIFAFKGKEWADVDEEKGNFDYLMGADLDLSNPETVANLNRWGKWYQALTQVDGYRLDAVKHMRFNFWIDWLKQLVAENIPDKEMYVVAEYWSNELDTLVDYLDASGSIFDLFDVPLHYHLLAASDSMGSYDMRNLFQGTLVDARPDFATTFVDNHDTQKGQSLESWIEGWFKVQAYAAILLRRQGTPMVFYGDLFGIPTEKIDPVGPQLAMLLKIRRLLADGPEVDYLDHEDIIGWTRTGTLRKPHSGFAVVMTNRQGGTKEMTMSAIHAGEIFRDALGNCEETVTIDDEGQGVFPVKDGSISVWVNEETLERLM